MTDATLRRLQQTGCDVRADRLTRILFATDASIYQIDPEGAAFPRSAEEASAVIRGLRAVSDFEFEFQMALMNRQLDAAVETIFLMPKEEYTYLSSRIVKEIARLGGNVSSFVPACVAKALSRKFS